MINNDKRIIGIWGYPDPNVLKSVRSKYPDNIIVDLDINYNNVNTGILPEAYCRIIRNIVDNATALRDKIDIIIASVGEEKCDAARLTSILLKDLGFNVLDTKYEKYTEKPFITPVSQSNLPLKDKIITIMDSLIQPVEIEYDYIKPEFGFWGVPPNDNSFLDLFPDNTHVYGWVRAVEAGRPADMEIEMHVDEDIPTVFFAQAFCSKMQIAKYLAKKHNGLYIDIDDRATNSVKAKIEAFIKLR